MDWNTILTTIGTIVSALAAAFSVYLARGAAKESRDAADFATRQNEIAESSRKLMIKPQVVVYARGDAKRELGNLINIHIGNVGPGAARNVKFEVIGEDFLLPSKKRLSLWRPIEHGLSVIVPGELISTFAFNIYDKKEEDPTPDIRINVEYEDIEGKKYGPEENSVDLDVIWNSARVKHSSGEPIVKIADSLEKMSKNIR